MSMIVFVLGRLMGDPARLLVSIDASQATLMEAREELGLNDPILVQFQSFVVDALRGGFGDSFHLGVSSTDLLLDALPKTLMLAASAISIALLLGICMGVAAALKPRSWLDTTVGAVSVAGVAVPSFWAALLLIFWLGADRGLLPTSGYGTWQHLVLPAIVLAMRPVGVIAQITRSSMLDELRQQYVITGFAKGLTMTGNIRNHVLKNASIPIMTVAGVEAAELMTGVIVVEAVFDWPGVGRLAAESMISLDYPVIQTVVFWAALVVILLNLVVDLSYAWLDPRTKLT